MKTFTITTKVPLAYSLSGFFFPKNYNLTPYIAGYDYKLVECGDGYIACFKNEKAKLNCLAEAYHFAEIEGISVDKIFPARAKQVDFIRIDWKKAKELVISGKMTAIGSNLGQIHPSGEYSISADGKNLYKRRTGMAFDDKIATAN